MEALPMVETRRSPPPEVKEALDAADNVTGAEVTAPFETDGEVHARFGLWVGSSEDEAELETFEIDREQIEGLSELFTRLAEAAVEVNTDG
jgi:hypothetical protein